MTRTLMKTALSALVLGLLATSVQAGYGRDGRGHGQAFKQSQAFSQQVNARQTRQTQRVETARRAGLLSRHDFRALTTEQHRIRAMERRFRADGIIDVREFQRLDRALDLAARNIRTQTLARNTRPGYGASHRFN
ncbi:MAG: hypothetical protein Q8R61_02760 [Thiobacillus sp.]|uniref:hypothetical protein n=1 Tax=Thiobacillus sp. TaxID=924 RepID=UPI0027363B2D|nr:hypothetical protein [Thiobacillus sp.]MDP3584018.1 hypothetical protein [Thiobacillus sp.]